MESSLEYYDARAKQERKSAANAGSVEAKIAHMRLASLYESVVAGGSDISARNHPWRNANLDRYIQD